MKLQLKNSLLVFNKSDKLIPFRTLSDQYVSPAPRIASASGWLLLVFEVKKGQSYSLKTNPTNWAAHGVDTSIDILSSADCNIDNAGTAETYAAFMLQHVGYWENSEVSKSITFTPNQNGYLYVSGSTNGSWTIELV